MHNPDLDPLLADAALMARQIAMRDDTGLSDKAKLDLIIQLVDAAQGGPRQ